MLKPLPAEMDDSRVSLAEIGVMCASGVRMLPIDRDNMYGGT